jgi:hypothetical protein
MEELEARVSLSGFRYHINSQEAHMASAAIYEEDALIGLTIIGRVASITLHNKQNMLEELDQPSLVTLNKSRALVNGLTDLGCHELPN